MTKISLGQKLPKFRKISEVSYFKFFDQILDVYNLINIMAVRRKYHRTAVSSHLKLWQKLTSANMNVAKENSQLSITILGSKRDALLENRF